MKEGDKIVISYTLEELELEEHRVCAWDYMKVSQTVLSYFRL